jgi:hypothetical protein
MPPEVRYINLKQLPAHFPGAGRRPWRSL